MPTPFRMIWFSNFTCRNWDSPDNRTYHWLDPHMYVEAAHRLETRGVFDAIVIADTAAIPTDYEGTTDVYVKKGTETAGMGDPIPTFAAMSARTRDIGMISTQSTELYPPRLLAQTIGTLDHLTAGRAGWNIVTTSGWENARNYGMDGLPPGDVRYDRAELFVEQVSAMWRTADDTPGAAADLHLPPSPQGTPVLMQAGGSERGREFAAKHAEVIITHSNTVESMKAFRDDLRARMERIGRDPDTAKVFFTLRPVIADTHEEAEAVWAAQRARPAVDVETGLAYYSSRIGYDLSTLDLDEPLPADLSIRGSQGIFRQHLEGGKGPTLRDIARAEAVKDSYLALGTAAEVAEQLSAAMDFVGGDGFAVRETFHPSHITPIVDELMPLLRAKGVARSQYRYDTLRANLLDPDFTATSAPVGVQR